MPLFDFQSEVFILEIACLLNFSSANKFYIMLLVSCMFNRLVLLRLDFETVSVKNHSCDKSKETAYHELCAFLLTLKVL